MFPPLLLFVSLFFSSHSRAPDVVTQLQYVCTYLVRIGLRFGDRRAKTRGIWKTVTFEFRGVAIFCGASSSRIGAIRNEVGDSLLTLTVTWLLINYRVLTREWYLLDHDIRLVSICVKMLQSSSRNPLPSSRYFKVPRISKGIRRRISKRLLKCISMRILIEYYRLKFKCGSGFLRKRGMRGIQKRTSSIIIHATAYIYTYVNCNPTQVQIWKWVFEKKRNARYSKKKVV